MRWRAFKRESRPTKMAVRGNVLRSRPRPQARASIKQARASRTERALTEGLALRAERVAKLKEHAEVLDALRFVPDKNGRLWNERAYRQTLADIAEEMGERRPKESERSGE